MDLKSRVYKNKTLNEANLKTGGYLIKNDCTTVNANTLVTFDEFSNSNNTINNNRLPYLDAKLIKFNNTDADYSKLPTVRNFTSSNIITTEKELQALLSGTNVTLSGTYYIKSGDYTIYGNKTIKISGTIFGNNTTINLPESTVNITGSVQDCSIISQSTNTDTCVVISPITNTYSDPIYPDKVNIFKIRGPLDIELSNIQTGKEYLLYIDQITDIAYPVNIIATFRNVIAHKAGTDYPIISNKNAHALKNQIAGKRYVIRLLGIDSRTVANQVNIPNVNITGFNGLYDKSITYPTNLSSDIIKRWVGPGRAFTGEEIAIYPVMGTTGAYVRRLTIISDTDTEYINPEFPLKITVGKSDIQIKAEVASKYYSISQRDLLQIVSYSAYSAPLSAYPLVNPSTGTDINTVPVDIVVPSGYSLQGIESSNDNISGSGSTYNIRMTDSNTILHTKLRSLEYNISDNTGLTRLYISNDKPKTNEVVYIIYNGEYNIRVSGASYDCVKQNGKTLVSFRQGTSAATISR